MMNVIVREYYQSRKKRDERYRELKKEFGSIKKGVCDNQLLHPMYVEDFEGSEKKDTEFGNQVYKTYFKKLYSVSVYD